MKALLEKAAAKLKPLGFQKKESSFWRIDNEVYKMIDFQKGSHGGKYYFINLCVHPLGLPLLTMERLVIPTRPKEYDCLVRQRIEQVSSDAMLQPFRSGFVSTSADLQSNDEILTTTSRDGVNWLDRWGTHEALAKADEEELTEKLTVAPVLWLKAYAMVKCFCLLRIGERDSAREFFNQFLSEKPTGLDLSEVENHILSLFEELS